ncbi:MAG: glycosyltransferase family 9 protein [Lentisphaerae bacterium]|nr:glycosyltransferase family 9 protein [Lentisphaerota bacterium]
MSAASHTWRRLLVLRGGAVGDFVLTLPALSALRAHGLRADIELVTYPRTGRLALAGGLADRVRSLDDAAVAALFSPGADLAPPLRAVLAACDLAVSFLHDPGAVVRSQLQAGGVARVLAVAPPMAGPAPAGAGHAADDLAAPLCDLGVAVTLPAVPRLNLPPALIAAGRALLPGRGRPVVTLHPGSGSCTKNWPLERFLALADRLAGELDLCPVMVLGEAERLQREALTRAGCRHPLLPACDLAALAGVLASVRAHVGNDSGVTHLAASVGVPVVALFGPTDPARWGPRGDGVRVLQSAEGLAGLAVEMVFDVVKGIR